MTPLNCLPSQTANDSLMQTADPHAGGRGVFERSKMQSGFSYHMPGRIALHVWNDRRHFDFVAEFPIGESVSCLVVSRCQVFPHGLDGFFAFAISSRH
jgi:hypothetical protein